MTDFLLDRANDLSNPYFNLELGLSNWVESLGAGRNHIMVLGDSNVVDEVASRSAWARQLGTALRTFTGQGHGGDGYQPTDAAEWTAGGFMTPSEGGPNTVYDVFPNGGGFYGLSGSVATWTRPAGFSTTDRFEILMADHQATTVMTSAGLLGVQPANALHEYSDDGGAFTQVAFTITNPATPVVIGQTVVGSIATTLRLRNSNPFGTAVFGGASFFNGTTGLIVHNLGISGNYLGQMVGGVSRRLALLDYYQPVLTIVWAGAKDNFAYGEAPLVAAKPQERLASYEAYLREIVEKGRTHGDVLILSPHGHNESSSWFGGVRPHGTDDFERVSRTVAYETDSAHINLRAALGDFSRLDARGHMTDDLHLGQTGHDLVTRVLKQSIEAVS